MATEQCNDMLTRQANPPNAPAAAFRQRVTACAWPWVGLLVALAFYAWTQARCFVPATHEVDCEGYFVLGKRLAHGEPAGRIEPDPFIYQSHVWVRNGRGELLPKYDPGYPLLLGLAYRVDGDRGAFLVSPVMGGLVLLGAFLLYRLWMPRLAATLGTMLLALHPMIQAYSGYPLTHITETACAVWGFYFLWRWMQRQGLASALAAGLVLGFATTIRHAAVLFGLAVAAALAGTLWRVRPRRGRPLVTAIALALAYALFPLALALYHWRWFGSPLTSGYALSGEQQALSWRYALGNFTTLLNGLNGDCAPLLLPLALVGLARVGSRLERLVRTLWLVPLCLLYLFYYWAPPGWIYSRFLLSTVPLLVGLALPTVQRIPGSPTGRTLGLCTYATLVGAYFLFSLGRTLAGHGMNDQARPRAAVAAAIAPHLREDAALFVWPPIDTGIGAHRRYRPYRLVSFQPGFVESEMPPWNEPDLRQDARRSFRERWAIKVQPERRAELVALYETLGATGLASQRTERVTALLQASNQVAFLLRPTRHPHQQAGISTHVTLRPRVTFDAAWQGTWTLFEAFLPDDTTEPPGAPP